MHSHTKNTGRNPRQFTGPRRQRRGTPDFPGRSHNMHNKLPCEDYPGNNSNMQSSSDIPTLRQMLCFLDRKTIEVFFNNNCFLTPL